MNPQPPPAAQWTQPVQLQRSASGRLTTVALIGIGLIATAALVVGIVALSRPTSPTMAPAPAATTAAASPSFTAADEAAAKGHVCTTFDNVSNAVKIATSAPNGAEPVAASANARAALVGAALELSRSVAPATPKDLAKLAGGLVDAYLDYVVTAFAEQKADSTPVENATNALRQACG